MMFGDMGNFNAGPKRKRAVIRASGLGVSVKGVQAWSSCRGGPLLACTGSRRCCLRVRPINGLGMPGAANRRDVFGADTYYHGDRHGRDPAEGPKHRSWQRFEHQGPVAGTSKATSPLPEDAATLTVLDDQQACGNE